MFRNMIENVKNTTPLVHCITNYVTVNDCANILLACGGSPIMADEPAEVEEITSICGGLAINIGTLNRQTITSMFMAGKKSNEVGHPVILDPVGAGASALRTNTALDLMKEVKFTVLRGNISEIKTLAYGSGTTKGVDADELDAVSEKNLEISVEFAKNFSKETGAVIAITGAIDIVADKEKAYVIRNGHPMMAKITGSGCMLTAMIGAYLTANPDHPLEATAAAVTAMGLCGEKAYNKLQEANSGNSSYRNYLIDEIFKLDGEELNRGARYDMW
ncbi:hydroxyethylthiazole kinase [Clostridium aminobutyricum]|uniref:Hydroxyethylthiazole kinase n=1 Tax=Clostridium aminobutyricum TaxID=33953 RepID=A0A939D8M1_CLOAM|nr:hydroxyethylthiazole kinase [Clostridium aminobutyricum]MBN7773105.1 hydroxyethylthiazole kinase [Clostridium aminobutyricum]